MCVRGGRTGRPHTPTATCLARGKGQRLDGTPLPPLRRSSQLLVRSAPRPLATISTPFPYYEALPLGIMCPSTRSRWP